MKHMLSSALVAGFAAGLLCALLQFLLVQPKILLAERYEAGELVHFQGIASPQDRAAAMAQAMPDMDMTAEGSEHHHDEGAEGGAHRQALTVLFAVLTYCGYGLVLIAGMNLAEQVGIKLSLSQGILWGLAGFLAFQMMPALGLQPDLPGTPAADLTARQIWWAATAAATGVGLWFAAYGQGLWQRAAGLVILVAPHIWGAPELASFGGVVPPELASSFAARSLAVGMVTWAVLGGLIVTLWHSDPAP
ncbi:MAG: CbtA family protein [Pseudomonadota bacterium]